MFVSIVEGLVSWIAFFQSIWQKNLFVPNDSIIILKSNEDGCQKQKWCIFFQAAFVTQLTENILECLNM